MCSRATTSDPKERPETASEELPMAGEKLAVERGGVRPDVFLVVDLEGLDVGGYALQNG